MEQIKEYYSHLLKPVGLKTEKEEKEAE